MYCLRRTALSRRRRMRRRVAIMARIGRTTGLKGVALVVAFASLTINFGLIDLIDGFTGYIDQARNQILDVGWGAVFGVILPLGLLSQLRRPETRIAGIQQTAVVASALALAGAAGQKGWYLALAGGIAVASAVLLALHPAQQTFLAPGAARRADDARARNRCRWSSSRLCLADGLGPAAGSSARRCCVQRSPPLDRDDGARATRCTSHAPCRRSNLGLADPGPQRVDRGRRLGDLVPPGSVFSSG